MDLFKPTECFRKYYTIEKYEPKCSCIWKCKYPPPKKLALENNKTSNEMTRTDNEMTRSLVSLKTDNEMTRSLVSLKTDNQKRNDDNIFPKPTRSRQPDSNQ